MKRESRVKKVLKPLVNVRAWMGVDWLKHHGSFIKNLWHSLFKAKNTPPPAVTESFEAALARLNISEEALQKRQREYRLMLAFFLLLAAAIFSYTIYLLLDTHFKGGIIALSLTFFALGQAFRCHFWLFQINQRKLGCTFKEWRNYAFGVKK